MKKPWYLLSVAAAYLLISGCVSGMSPSDDEAVMLLKNYYAFYESKEVEATVIHRGALVKDCDCYPIEFQIMNAKDENFKRTFYFYKKNGSGEVAIKKFKFGLKNSS